MVFSSLCSLKISRYVTGSSVVKTPKRNAFEAQYNASDFELTICILVHIYPPITRKRSLRYNELA